MKRIILHGNNSRKVLTHVVSQKLAQIIFIDQFCMTQAFSNRMDTNLTNNGEIILKQKDGAKETLDLLLTKNHQEHDITYNGYFSNHLVHAISSLYSLGASSERLRYYYNYYSQKLVPLRETNFTINDSNWTSFIEDTNAYPEYLQFFDNQVQTLGQKNALDKYIPRLIPGLMGGLLHPLIHIGYGLEYNNSKVLAEGLSYACTYYNNGGELIDTIPYENIESNQTCSNNNNMDLLEEIKLLGIKARPYRQPYSQNISGLLTKFNPEIKELLGRIDMNSNLNSSSSQDILNSHTNAIIHIFFGTYRQKSLDFFLAHGLTGNHAIRIILPYLNELQQKRLLRISLLSIIYLYLREGMPEFDDKVIYQFSSNRDKINWDYILDKVVNCVDEHVIKVVRTLIVVRNQIPNSLISHELIDRCGFMMVNTVKEEAEWIFNGIGYLPAEAK